MDIQYGDDGKSEGEISPELVRCGVYGQRTILRDGYGGFEISLNPSYSATRGKLWLERGGVYVLANIRGGGEYGPKWHQAGLKTERQRIYDDFISVAESLIERSV